MCIQIYGFTLYFIYIGEIQSFIYFFEDLNKLATCFIIKKLFFLYNGISRIISVFIDGTQRSTCHNRVGK